MKNKDALLFFTAAHKCSPFGLEILMDVFYPTVRKMTFMHVCVHRETVPHSTTHLHPNPAPKQDLFIKVPINFHTFTSLRANVDVLDVRWQKNNQVLFLELEWEMNRGCSLVT